MERRPLARLAVLLLLVAAPPAAAAPGTDLLEPDAGTETAATAEELGPGSPLRQRVVLGPPEVRDVDWFVARTRPGATLAVRVEHGGEVGGRGLDVRVPRRGAAGRTVAGGVRSRRLARVGDGRTRTVRARADDEGRVRLLVRCAGAGCAAPGAIPYRVGLVERAAR